MAPPAFEKVYSAESPLTDPARFLSDAWKDLMGARSTAVRLFRQKTAQRYRYSSLGLAWAFAPPAITAFLLTLTKGVPHAAGAPSQTPPQFYAVFGLMLAQTFLETFNTQRTIFSSHRYEMSFNRAPMEGPLLAGIADNLFSLSIRFGILIVLFILFRTSPAVTLPLGLLGIGSLFLLGSGLGLLLAPLSALKIDVENATSLFPWLLFVLTPIFVETKPGVGLSQIYRYNPFTWIFDATRAFTYGTPAGHGPALALSLSLSVCLLPLAWLFCRIARPYVVERFLK